MFSDGIWRTGKRFSFFVIVIYLFIFNFILFPLRFASFYYGLKTTDKYRLHMMTMCLDWYIRSVSPACLLHVIYTLIWHFGKEKKKKIKSNNNNNRCEFYLFVWLIIKAHPKCFFLPIIYVCCWFAAVEDINY